MVILGRGQKLGAEVVDFIVTTRHTTSLYCWGLITSIEVLKLFSFFVISYFGCMKLEWMLEITKNSLLWCFGFIFRGRI